MRHFTSDHSSPWSRNFVDDSPHKNDFWPFLFFCCWNRHNYHRSIIHYNAALENLNIQHNRALIMKLTNIWSSGSVKFWHSCCGGCSVHYDYDDFWMKKWKWANFWTGHRILKVKKRKMIRISPGIHFWGLNCTFINNYCLKFNSTTWWPKLAHCAPPPSPFYEVHIYFFSNHFLSKKKMIL